MDASLVALDERLKLRTFARQAAVAGIVEPTVIEKNLTLYPEPDDESRAPNFIVYIFCESPEMNERYAGEPD
jgi:hypothetical protein